MKNKKEAKVIHSQTNVSESPKSDTNKKEAWEILARKLFNPYAVELKFDARDWEVFLNRLSEVVSQERKKVVEEIEKSRRRPLFQERNKIMTINRNSQIINMVLDEIIKRLK